MTILEDQSVQPGTSHPERGHGRDVDDAHETDVPLGPALRRAWVAYQRRLDQAMASAGFDDRRFPDERVLRMCRNSPGTTISQIGRELGITRQGAAKVTAHLRDRGYVSIDPSPTSGREKTVTVTARALDYLAAQREAARAIEDDLWAQVGSDAFTSFRHVLHALGGDEDMRMRDYLRNMDPRN